ncbi:26s proteasome regulatory subunit S2 [Cryptosporidium ubiquitum]|uniref:26s proteasome regulatory subunit S2 n=1 Tax=Cryptosporidium ubiquitum TaxID=857276 RepID=A0A1J4M9T4_9CRYT|nr:26s proteasome regulatory subunit S2 [Cryptosporidium ubiquitum]OII70984.1 26s proteasome regulatory subunit S2 [Cryptosporidium ubiquitum]
MTSDKENFSKNEESGKKEGLKEGESIPNVDMMDLTEEDKILKEEIDGLVEKVISEESGFEVSKSSLESLSSLIKTSTSGMTSVPKALKFLGIHYQRLKEFCDSQISKKSQLSELSCEIISVLSTTLGDMKERKALSYRLLSGNKKGILDWGQEYVRNIVGEITLEYSEIQANQDLPGASDQDVNVSDLLELVKIMVPYQIEKHCELEAIDLLCEVEQMETLLEYLTKIDVEQMERIVLYLQQLSQYAISAEEHDLYLKLCFELLLSFEKHSWAVSVALKLDGQNCKEKIFSVIDDIISYDSKRSKIKNHEAKDSNSLNLSGNFKVSGLSILKQIFFQLAKFSSNINLEELKSHLISRDFCKIYGESELSIIEEIFSNEYLSKFYLFLAKELEVLEPKTPEEIYKTHLEENSRYSSRSMMVLDTAKQNLASTYVNALVNVGFCKDKLIGEDDSSWLYKNKDSGKMAVSASLGVINLWNIDEGLANIDKFQWSDDPFIKAGALIAFGLISIRIKNDCDPSFALLSEYINSGDEPIQEVSTSDVKDEGDDVKMEVGNKTTDKSNDNKISIIKTVVPNYTIRMGAILGLGYSYIGTCRDDILELLIPVLMDPFSSLECSAISALSLGLIFSGSGNQSIIEAVLDLLLTIGFTSGGMDDGESNSESKKKSSGDSQLESNSFLDDPLSILYGLCLGLLFLGKREACETTLEALSVITHPIGAHCRQTVVGCAYAGSGDVLKIQEMQRVLVEETLAKGGKKRAEEEDQIDDEESDISVLVCVLNMALISLGEEIGSEMSLRALDNVLQYSSVFIRRAVPISLAALSIGNPKPVLIDTISKLTHDSDPDVALNAIFALGLISAGTNNARTANLLRQLASYYGKDKHALYAVRIAQGFLYMGKGLVTVNPCHTNKLLLNPISLVSIITTLHLALRSRTILFGNYHYLLLSIVPAITPRHVITVDTSLAPVQTLVRVGQMVDTVGQAGNPRKITGFQTHNTPVLLGFNERAELATDEFVPACSSIEDIVILERNPEAENSGINGSDK